MSAVVIAPGAAAHGPRRSALTEHRVRYPNDPTTGNRSRSDPHPMRLQAGRPRLKRESLEPPDLGWLGYFLPLAGDDHAPPGPFDGITAVDLKRHRPRTQGR